MDKTESNLLVRHVLFDADGVLQSTPGGFTNALRRHLGNSVSDFRSHAGMRESGVLDGATRFMPLLEQLLKDYGVKTPADKVFADAWESIEVNEPALGVVKALRDREVGVHLGTNQCIERADYMKKNMGYENILQVRCYSCDMGVAKPEPEYFSEAALRIGAPASEILFIDDRENNVEGAKLAGMNAECWDLDQGIDVLWEVLGKYGFNRD